MNMKFDGYDIFSTVRWALVISIIIIFVGIAETSSKNRVYLGKLVTEEKAVRIFNDTTHEITMVPYIVTYRDDAGKIIEKHFESSDDYVIVNTKNAGSIVYLDKSPHSWTLIILISIWVIMFCLMLAINFDDTDVFGDSHYGNPFKPVIALILLPVYICRKHREQ